MKANTKCLICTCAVSSELGKANVLASWISRLQVQQMGVITGRS